MEYKDILSEKPEDLRNAVKWAKQLEARRIKSEFLTKELLKEFTPEYIREQELAPLPR